MKKLMFKLVIPIVFLFLGTLNLFAQDTISPFSQEYDNLKVERIAQHPEQEVYSGTYPQIKVLYREGSRSGGLLVPLDETFQVAMQPNDDHYTSEIALPFTFNFYGNELNSFFINNNGNISFNGGYWEYTPYGFPVNDYPMLAPFWADVDTRPSGSGLVYYKIESNRVIVTWDNVGYYSYEDDKLNTFQVIFTDGTDPLIGIGNNVAFSYTDMQWTTGSASSGSNGFGGVAATVGINNGDGVFFEQIGRFDHAGSDYDGPGGNNDGISFLDDQVFIFDVSSTDFVDHNFGGIYIKIIETAGTNQVHSLGYKYQYKLEMPFPLPDLTITKESDCFVVQNVNNERVVFITGQTVPLQSLIGKDFLDQIILYDVNEDQIGHINFDYEFRWEDMHTRHATLFFHNDDAICNSVLSYPYDKYFPYSKYNPNNPPNKKYNYYDDGEYPVSMLIPPHYQDENGLPEGYRFPETYNSTPILFVHGLTGTFSYSTGPNLLKGVNAPRTFILGDQVSYWGHTEHLINDKEINGNKKYHGWQFYYPNEDDLEHCGLMLGKAIDKLDNYYTQPINIVTHSMGGLVTMEYLTTNTDEIPNYSQQKIGKVLLSMSPIHGSLASNVHYRSTRSAVLRFFKLLKQDPNAPCYRDMSIGSDFVFNLNQREWDDDLIDNTFVLMGLANDWYQWPIPYNTGHTEASKHHDGPVSYSSASLLDKGIGFATFYGNHDDGRHGKPGTLSTLMEEYFLPNLIDDYLSNGYTGFRSLCLSNDEIEVFVEDDGNVIKPSGMNLNTLNINEDEVNFQKGLVTLMLENTDQILYLYRKELIGPGTIDYCLSPNNNLELEFGIYEYYYYTKLGRFHKNRDAIGDYQNSRYFFTKNMDTRTDAGFDFDNNLGGMGLIKLDAAGWVTPLNSITTKFVQHQFHFAETGMSSSRLALSIETTPTKVLNAGENNGTLSAEIFVDNQTTEAIFYLYSESAGAQDIPYHIKLVSPGGTEVDSTSENTLYDHDTQTTTKKFTVLNVEPGMWQMIPIYGSRSQNNIEMITKGELVSEIKTMSLINSNDNSVGSNILLSGLIEVPDLDLLNLDSLHVTAYITRESFNYDSVLLDNFQITDTGLVFSNDFFLDSTGIYRYTIIINGTYDDFWFERALYGDFAADDHTPKLIIPDQEMSITNSFVDLKLPDFVYCEDCNEDSLLFNISLNSSNFDPDTLSYEYLEVIKSLYLHVIQESSPGEASFEVECTISDTIDINTTFTIRFTPPGVPINLTATNIGYFSADIDWLSTDLETEWDILYGPSGFDPQTEGNLLLGITQHPQTLTGLDTETTYDFYVRAVFEEDVSYWSWPETFETLSEGSNMAGQFTDSNQELGTSSSTGVALGDLDGDGDLDAAIANDVGGQPNKVWLNDGNGNFTDSGLSFGNAVSWGIALGDLDGDGDLDGFIANEGPNKVYLNNGTNTTHNGQNLGNASSHDVKLADLDGDGDLDAAVANNASGQPNKVWLNDGDGNFNAFAMNFGNAISWGLALGDLDGDGYIDGFIANDGPNKVYINAGTYTTDNGQNLGNASGKGVRLGDMDGDGDLDAVIANDATGQPNIVWLNDGDGDFTDSGLSFGDNLSMGLALGDLDNDGDLDGFVANNGPNKVYLNDGSNTTDNGQFLGNSNSYAVALGDLDGDGDLDAFVANYDGPNKVWLNQTVEYQANSQGASENDVADQNADDSENTSMLSGFEDNTSSDVLLENYPDPFTNRTTIRFKVNKTGEIVLKILNQFGKVTDVLYDATATAGQEYNIGFQGGHLPAGIYVILLQGENGLYAQEKIVLVK